LDSALGRFLTIALGSTVLACLLGICLDLVTANVAVEYFSVHHPKFLPTENPWILALFWGVAASWWFGEIAGATVALINHRRQRPLEPIRILKRSTMACVVLWTTMILILLTVMAISSRIPMEQRRATFESDRRLVAVAMAHQFEYVLGAVAVMVIAVMTWRSSPNCLATEDSDKPRKAQGSDLRA
jgi:hypothetical protein